MLASLKIGGTPDEPAPIDSEHEYRVPLDLGGMILKLHEWKMRNLSKAERDAEDKDLEDFQNDLRTLLKTPPTQLPPDLRELQKSYRSLYLLPEEEEKLPSGLTPAEAVKQFAEKMRRDAERDLFSDCPGLARAMKDIPIVQFLRPNRVQRQAFTQVSDEAAARFDEIAKLGLLLTAELIPAGTFAAQERDLVHVCLRDEDVAQDYLEILMPLGPGLQEAIGHMLINFDEESNSVWLTELETEQN